MSLGAGRPPRHYEEAKGPKKAKSVDLLAKEDRPRQPAMARLRRSTSPTSSMSPCRTA